MAIKFVDLPGAPWNVLEEGIHSLSLEEFKDIFATNQHRRKQFDGLVSGLKALKTAGCTKVYIDGSYVTKKDLPSDYDACWDHNGVDINKLAPEFKDFSNGRQSQKDIFEGEFFPAYVLADKNSKYIDFFQKEKHSGKKKGIVLLDLSSELNVKGN